MFLFPDSALRAGRAGSWYPETAAITTKNGNRME